MYEYAGLTEKASIRVLELLPASTGSPLHCYLRKYSLRSIPIPSFEALSYTWGDPACRHDIVELSSNSTIPITDNLQKALQALRKPTTSRFLWIDAICINQANNTEKSSQVAYMGEIYRSATTVLVWLGERDCSDIFDGFKELSRFYNEKDFLAFETNTKQVNLRPPHLGQLRQMVETHIMPYFDTCFGSDWFDRIWTVQEFVMASDITIYASDRSIEYREFRSALYLLVLLVPEPLFNRSEVALERRKRVLRAWGFSQGREKYQRSVRNKGVGTSSTGLSYKGQERQVMPIVEWCIYYRSHQCTNAHDRVYGMLGLTGNNLAIVPDYDKPIEHVWVDVTQRHLRNGDLCILRYSQPVSALVGEEGGPFPLSQYLAGFGALRYHAGQDTCQIDTTRRNRPKLLGLSVGNVAKHVDQSLPPGMCSPGISTIDEFLHASQRAPDASLMVAVMRHLYTRCEDVAAERAWPYGERFLPVFARCLVAGTWDEHIWNDMILYLAIVLLFEMRGEEAVVVQQKLEDVLGPRMVGCMEAAKNVAMDPERGKETDQAYAQREIRYDIEPRDNDDAPASDERLLHFPADMMEHAEHYLREAGMVMYGRVWFVTGEGYMGIGPQYMRDGDLVVIFAGADTPYIIRPTAISASSKKLEGDVEFDLVGECFLAGWMKGDLYGHGVVDGWDDEVYSTQIVEDGEGEGKREGEDANERRSTRRKRTGGEKLLQRTKFQLSEIRVKMPT
ncbi:HET-domain-containing protein [Amniculicola lignicola CBS 123094]|uniref:HET-domain-containing protein n=1 Tax=Amniculicola lignicola CBS 123094 TaxID=1392246 RepID=A0A6A5WZU6_9PLEO|nr:HET-domain-containing protein [Amniculicola lignicola CBS 123094]